MQRRQGSLSKEVRLKVSRRSADEQGPKNVLHRGKSVCEDQEDRGQDGAFAHREEVPDSLGAERQMGICRGKGGRMGFPKWH